MLGWAVLCLAVACGAPAFGYSDVGREALNVALFLFVAYIAIAVVAVMFHRPLERRVLHHA